MPHLKNDETKEFYQALDKAFDQGLADGLFVKLPPPMSREVLGPLLHLSRRWHMKNPTRGPDEGWLCVYNKQSEYAMAVPEAICPDGIVTLEAWHSKMDENLRRLKARLRKLEPHYGKFEVRRLQGRIWIRHAGPIPV